MKLELTRSSETSSANLIHTPCIHPRTKKYYSHHGKSLKTQEMYCCFKQNIITRRRYVSIKKWNYRVLSEVPFHGVLCNISSRTSIFSLPMTQGGTVVHNRMTQTFINIFKWIASYPNRGNVNAMNKSCRVVSSYSKEPHFNCCCSTTNSIHF
jgi:hypothetical protein